MIFRMRILVIDDDKNISGLLKDGLELAYYAVDVADNGKDGSYLARTNEYDVVILDNKLPEKQGIDVCHEIRDSGKTMPIIILSVITDVEVKTKLLDECADDYMTKPFSLKELQAHIRAVLRRPYHLQSDILKVDNLTLDTKTHRVRRGRKKITLTRTEYIVLEYLMLNQGIPLRRGKIMEHVWDMDANPFSHALETHIWHLRRKIDTTGQKRLIRTVHGVGYTIDGA